MPKSKQSKDIALRKEFPIIDSWLQVNASFRKGVGIEASLAAFQADIEGFLTPAELKKLREDLVNLQEEIEKQRTIGRWPTDSPRNWRYAVKTILLRSAEQADLFDTEIIGEY